MPTTLLTESQQARYARHLSLPNFGPTAQLRLMSAKVLIIGAGGLGSPVCFYLTAAGVGTLGILESDSLELSNLQRQILYTINDLGKSKTDSAQRHLQKLNPEVTLILHNLRLTPVNAADLLAPYDLIVNCTDNFPTRYLINATCVRLQKILVDAAISQFEALASIFAPHLKEWQGQPIETGCYCCLFPEPPEGEGERGRVGGVMGPMCGILGSIQATEALKILTHLGNPLFGKLLRLNALTMEFRTLTLRQNKDCPICRSVNQSELRA